MTLTEQRDLTAQITALAREPGSRELLRRLLASLHPSDLAELLASLDSDAALLAFSLLDPAVAPEVLDELDSETAALVLDRVPAPQIAELLETLPADDAAEVLAEAGPDHAPGLLAGLSAGAPEEAAEIRTLLGYRERTAGRLMVMSYLRVTPDLSAGECMAKVRRSAADCETIYTIYVVGSGPRCGQLLGVLSLRDLLEAPPAASIGALMRTEPIHVDVDTDQAEVAHVISKYDLLSLPVLDREGNMAGIVTVDDALDVMVEEFDEQVRRITGSDAARMARKTPLQAAVQRIPWLLGTMVIELCSGLVIARFNWVLREVILLASFMPVISAVSGNTGLQAAAIAVRGIETGHVTRIRRVLPKEMLTSLIIAACVGLCAGIVGTIWSRHLPFGLVIGGGMFVSMQVAGLMGTAIPIVSKRLGFDPASTAGPFETAFQDVIGFAVFLWLASLFLPWITS